MNRFDLPTTFRDFLDVLVKTNTLDMSSAFVMGADRSKSYHDHINYGCEIAHINRHWNGDAHAKVVTAAEAFWKTEGTNPESRPPGGM